MEFKITGMMCGHCKAHVEDAIKAVEGVDTFEVNLASGTAVVEGDAEKDAIISAVKAAGYDCAAL